MAAAYTLRVMYTLSKYLFCLFIQSLCYVIGRVLWAGRDNAKKALPESENRSRVESHDDSGIFNSLNLLLVLV